VVIRWFAGGDGHHCDPVSGGKAPRLPCPRRILQPSEPMREIPGVLQAHGMAITVHLGGGPEIRRLVGGCSPQNQPTTGSQGLQGGMSVGERLQLYPFLIRQHRWGSIRDWHGCDPCLEPGTTGLYIVLDDRNPPALSRQKTEGGGIYEVDI
jgi:hypothetical protein